MKHLSRIGNRMSIPIKSDDGNFTGRECPQPDCEGYFKIEFGTGLKGSDLPCHCPYCGHEDGHDKFWTKEQIEYARSVALNKITDAISKDLKSLEFDHKPEGAFGIGLSLKVTSSLNHPIRYYREKELETELICNDCTLRYSVYGVFGYCPDCGKHNSLQILNKNLELVQKMVDLAKSVDSDLAEKLIENALEDCISAFDGFGREICNVYFKKASKQDHPQNVSFQNIDAVCKKLKSLYGVDILKCMSSDEWQAGRTCFQKRHLLTHKMGVIDAAYLRSTHDTKAVVGRKIKVVDSDVQITLSFIKKMAVYLFDEFKKLQ